MGSSKATRRKPRQARSEATVTAIVDAAARVLAKRGYAGTTTNHIAERAGVSIGSFYEYFRNKDAVVKAVMDRHITAAEALFKAHAEKALLGGDLSGSALVQLLVESFVEFHADDPRLHRVLTTEVPHSLAVRRRADELQRKIVDVVAGALAAHPAVRVKEPRLVAQMCVQTVDALAHLWVIDDARGPIPASTLTEELSRMLTAYLLAVG